MVPEVEWKEMSETTAQTSSHVSLILVQGKMNKGTLLKIEDEFSRIAISFVLTFGILHRLTGEQLRRYRFPQPPQSEQNAIIDHLDRVTTKINKLIKKVESAISLLTEYRVALITAATTGEIDVRNFNFGTVK